MLKRTLLLPVLVFIVAGAYAQPQKVVADKIAGIVGDKIILKSELSTAIQDMQRNGGAGAAVPDECTILDQMLIQKALVLQAEKDSLPVTDDEVDGELDLRVREFVRMYGSEKAVEELARQPKNNDSAQPSS